MSLSTECGDGKFVLVKDPFTKVKRKRACDMCRQRRRRCDGNERCNHCIVHNLPCTYLKSTPKKGTTVAREVRKSATDSDYVEVLKLRLRRAEDNLNYSCTSTIALKLTKTLEVPFAPLPEDSLSLDHFADSFRALSLDMPPGFQGQSSHAVFIKTVVAGKPDALSGSKPRGKPGPQPSALKPWHHHSILHPNFPDDSLMRSLVSLYFSHVNSFLPLLHRPLFEHNMNQRLYMEDPGFASTLLLVCALGSLYLTDVQDRKRFGWKWYNQVRLCGHSSHMKATLFDIQSYCLAAYFLSCTSNPRSSWSILGFGLYLAQDMGAHRRKATEPKITVEEELEKRALWILLVLETQLNASLGRTPVLDPIEIHVNLPSLLPGDIRDDMAYFNCLIKLYRLEAIALRFLYSSTVTPIRGQFADIRPVIDAWPAAPLLQAALDEWFRSIPERLMWHPDKLEGLALDQSASLHCLYHYTRLLIDRPFIPAMRSIIQPTIHTSAICTAAARECIRVAEIHQQKRPSSPPVLSQNPLFESAMVLLLEMWDEEVTQYMDSIIAAIDVLRSHREHSHPSSAFCIDVLERLLVLDAAENPKQPSIINPSGGSRDAAPHPGPPSGPHCSSFGDTTDTSQPPSGIFSLSV